MLRIPRQALGYAAVAAASFLLATLAGWLGPQIDNYAYDWIFRRQAARDARPESIVLAVDERSLAGIGGMRHLRQALAGALERIAPQRPSVVAIDLILADEGDASQDAALEHALAKLPRVVLACELVEGGARWENPLPRFRAHATALGHVHGDPGPLDGVSRIVPLAKAAGRDRRWALALEAFRLSRGASWVLESPRDLEIGNVRVPARAADSRALRIRYLAPRPDGTFPLDRVSLADLQRDPALAARFRGKVVFVGVTAQSAMRDRMLTPFADGSYMPGIEIHANIFETLARGRFLEPAGNLAVALAALALAAAAVLAFALSTGWRSYALAALVLGAAHALPYILFGRNVVFPFVAPVSAAWLAVVGGAAFQFVSVRLALRRSQDETVRYQQAMHFVTHEMRTPLTAIQGSSELIGRYNLSDEKRKQMAELIHSESKRLARMIETFLSVERLSAGQIALKKDVFEAREVLAACVERARPLAERKQIRLVDGRLDAAEVTGDRELMEYAIYNLLTNAVKYSPAETSVTAAAEAAGGWLRISVRDQGIGMEQHEIKKIFQKFYRTERAVASGEKGVGIGLSIVEQIVTHHGGRVEVDSSPGRGSCFTLVLPVRVREHASKG
ncbi:MAG TPA: CHASE2 domain-containing protein [Bryobacteraceae bacterium]|nr:CHASE2 domain-containing protein [Bryobacteraceae bacterium]